jgi:3-dehydroquinate dehydratase-2
MLLKRRPVIEVHISNTYSRESFRHQSYISGNAKGVILGLDYKAMSWRSDRFVKQILILISY